MSEGLKDALRFLKGQVDQNPDFPVTYLHDPETGKIFACMVNLDLFNVITDGLSEEVWNPYSHGHVEGDTDDEVREES